MNKKIKYRYGLILGNNKYGDWTGVFETLQDALNWYGKHGEYWKERGRNLKLLEIKK